MACYRATAKLCLQRWVVLRQQVELVAFQLQVELVGYPPQGGSAVGQRSVDSKSRSLLRHLHCFLDVCSVVDRPMAA